MQGSLSLGIYDGSGRLVRSLHRGDDIESPAFGKALNGLITNWDGKNDAGVTVSAGKYFARGYGVGDLGADGEAMHGNDFIVDDDSPRVKRILEVRPGADGKVEILTQTASGAQLLLTCDPAGVIQKPATPDATQTLGAAQPGPTAAVSASDGKLFVQSAELKTPALSHPTQACMGSDGGIWVIDHSDDAATEVKQISPTGEFIRRLAIPASEPVPVQLCASGSQLYLLEENQSMQRLRALALVTSGTAATSGTDSAVSTWKVLFSKTIQFSDTLEAARGLLKFPSGKPFEPQDALKVSLLPNPLMQDQPGSVEICAGLDAGGSFLKTKDGLLLQRISNTPNLKWTALGREPGSKALLFFQSDGAVVEEYRIARPANMMAFDCGDLDFSPAKP